MSNLRTQLALRVAIFGDSEFHLSISKLLLPIGCPLARQCRHAPRLWYDAPHLVGASVVMPFGLIVMLRE
jgi:hypothetical protein